MDYVTRKNNAERPKFYRKLTDHPLCTFPARFQLNPETLPAMYAHEYGKEISLKSRDKQMPMPVALLLVVLAGAGVWYGMVKIKSLPEPEPIVVHSATSSAVAAK
jgi:hypothetical protein